MLNSMKLKKLTAGLSLIAVAGLSSCNGGGGSGTYQSSSITANRFVKALNDVDGAPLYDESEVILYANETDRSKIVGEEDWFVIYDAEYDEYKAVSLQYVRSIVYYDYYSNDYAAADEFRNIESDDVLNGNYNGDYYGDDYETVDYDDYDGYFYGRNSGFAYEDESESTDVTLMAGELEQKKFFQQASNISYAYSVSLETAMSLVSLGSKVKGMVKKTGSELTDADQKALMGDVEKLTGVTISDIIAAGADKQKKDEVLAKVATKIGSTPTKVEDQLLPELIGLNL